MVQRVTKPILVADPKPKLYGMYESSGIIESISKQVCFKIFLESDNIIRASYLIRKVVPDLRSAI